MELNKTKERFAFFSHGQGNTLQVSEWTVSADNATTSNAEELQKAAARIVSARSVLAPDRILANFALKKKSMTLVISSTGTVFKENLLRQA